MAISEWEPQVQNEAAAGAGIDEAAFSQFCNSFSVGPVRINYCVDLTVPQVTFEVYVVGVRIGGGTLNAANPTITIGGSVAGFTVEANLTVDFSARQITYSIRVCVPVLGCRTYSGVLFSW
jgi:hypothetical protein